MTTITIWSEGGGFGKTTTTTNLAAALGQRGYTVLSIDFDPQPGSLINHVGYPELKDEDDPDATIVDALITDHIGLDDIIVETEHFDVVPAHEDLANLKSRADEAGVTMSMLLLRPALEPLAEQYDFILIDPPATINLLVDNALIASDSVLIPAEMTRKGEQSVKGVVDTIDALEANIKALRPNFSLDVLGVLPSKYSGSTLNQEIHAEITENDDLRADLLDINIADYNVVEDAWEAQQDLFTYAAENGLQAYQEKLLDAYLDLADHVVERTGPTSEPRAEVTA